jgi:hypothetical protein
LGALIDAVNSNDVERQYEATTKFRKWLSKESNPPIKDVIATGVVPKFVEFLRSPHALLQASWIGYIQGRSHLFIHSFIYDSLRQRGR